jgi:hypothetical protein
LDNEGGRITDLSNRQFENTQLSISCSSDPDSNVNDFRDFIPESAEVQSTKTDAGMQSDSSSLHSKKTRSSILDRFDMESKITEVRLEQPKKHCSPRKRVSPGMEMVSSDEQLQNASVLISRSCDSDSNVTTERDEQL